MSLFIGGMDATGMHPKENMHKGETSHIEYTWSNDIKEKILQFYFQLTQSVDDNAINTLKLIYRSLIETILTMPNNNPYHQDRQSQSQLTNEDQQLKLTAITIYKIIGQTRDIISGKGLYNLSYMMIAEWGRYSIIGPPEYKEMCEYLANEAITSFVKIESEKQPYGSWKDMKYFCNYWEKIENELLNSPQITQRRNNSTHEKPHNIMLTIINLICSQLKTDEIKLSKDKNTHELSLLAKWIPREKSNKFGWLTHHLAYTYYSHFLIHAMGKPNEMAARKKCLTHFRKTLTKLNKALYTPQINQCEQSWKNINFDKNVTSITMQKQSLAFQNKTKKNATRDNQLNSTKEDREICSNNYKEYVKQCSTKQSTAKGANISMIDFVKSAIDIESSNNEIEKSIINSQWENNSINTKNLGNIIAMVDTSGSMECDNGTPLYSAIGLGIRVAEKSAFGRRLLTFNSRPEWINLDNIEKKDFVSMVQTIRRAPWGMNANFYAALNLILQTIIEQELDPKSVEDMTLVIFSDMQIDSSSNENMDAMFETMKTLYAEAGLKTSYKTPYQTPHILFWNLRTTNGFPCMSSTKNTSMMSGSSPLLLNLFCDKGIGALKKCTPWNMMQEALSISRYNILEETMKTALEQYIS